MDKKNTILFDPGYAPIAINSLGQIGYIYYSFNAVPDLKLKRLNFPVVIKKIETYLKTNVAFYLGCMLWAAYIKQFENHEIEGNQLLGEVCEEKEYTDEINFLIDVVKNQLNRDSKYFLNKAYVADEKYLPILEAYKEFLILNKGFVECSRTDQIILPTTMKKLTKKELDLINEKIQKAIKEKNLELLFECYDLAF